MKDENENQLSDEVYRVVKKPGTNLANSSKTEGRKRALLQDEDGGMHGPPELVQVDPVVVEKQIVVEKPVYQTRIVKKEPSFLELLGRELLMQAIPQIPGVARELWEDHKRTKAIEARRVELEEQRRIAAIQRDAAAKELELERFKEQQRIAEEERQKYERLTDEQKQVISLSRTLNEAYYSFEQDMTKDEACRSLVRAFLHFVMFLKEIQNVKNARIIDDDTGEVIEGAKWIISLPWGQFLQDFNMLLKANPGWLEKYHIMMLSDAFGREIVVDGVYQPITAAEFESYLVKLT